MRSVGLAVGALDFVIIVIVVVNVIIVRSQCQLT